MKSYTFQSGKALIALCESDGITISEVMLRREMELSGREREDIIAEMRKNLSVMRTSVAAGFGPGIRSVSGLSGGDAAKLNAYASSADMGERMARIVAASMGVVEVNAAMGLIVAAPTAGASGILPASLLVLSEDNGWDDPALIGALFTAGAVGLIIAGNASISGASDGCQAETGSAASMTAAALASLHGASPSTCLTAAAIALKNVMGLVCDPVAGLVECPCIKRNAIGAANAVLSSDLALAGIKSLIPFDEVVSAMKAVGRSMSPDLRETANGGLAATPTGRAVRRRIRRSEPSAARRADDADR